MRAHDLFPAPLDGAAAPGSGRSVHACLEPLHRGLDLLGARRGGRPFALAAAAADREADRERGRRRPEAAGAAAAARGAACGAGRGAGPAGAPHGRAGAARAGIRHGPWIKPEARGSEAEDRGLAADWRAAPQGAAYDSLVVLEPRADELEAEAVPRARREGDGAVAPHLGGRELERGLAHLAGGAGHEPGVGAQLGKGEPEGARGRAAREKHDRRVAPQGFRGELQGGAVLPEGLDHEGPVRPQLGGGEPEGAAVPRAGGEADDPVGAEAGRGEGQRVGPGRHCRLDHLEVVPQADVDQGEGTAVLGTGAEADLPVLQELPRGEAKREAVRAHHLEHRRAIRRDRPPASQSRLGGRPLVLLSRPSDLAGASLGGGRCHAGGPIGDLSLGQVLGRALGGLAGLLFSAQAGEPEGAEPFPLAHQGRPG
mmetsp:Transcript_28688/g.64093  ORF Transcript_28688/g.64093 Transcript_28688/m.64093 type:complete len:427 (-) Transcript_28688:223-1503(-)